MRHAWIFDVLADLKLYAERNGLGATALKAAEDALKKLAPNLTPG